MPKSYRISQVIDELATDPSKLFKVKTAPNGFYNYYPPDCTICYDEDCIRFEENGIPVILTKYIVDASFEEVIQSVDYNTAVENCNNTYQKYESYYGPDDLGNGSRVMYFDVSNELVTIKSSHGNAMNSCVVNCKWKKVE